MNPKKLPMMFKNDKISGEILPLLVTLPLSMIERSGVKILAMQLVEKSLTTQERSSVTRCQNYFSIFGHLHG